MKNIKKTLLKLWKIWMILCTFLVTILLSVFIGILIFDPYFFAIDSCQDSGGGWNQEINQCFYEEDVQECMNKGGAWNYEANKCEGI